MRTSAIKKLGTSRIEIFKLEFLFKENSMPGHLVYEAVTDFATSFLSK